MLLLELAHLLLYYAFRGIGLLLCISNMLYSKNFVQFATLCVASALEGL